MNIIVKGGSMSKEEQKIYVEYLEQKLPNCNITDLELTITEEDGEQYVDMKYQYENKPETNVPVERCRRITGYIVPKIERWNNAKRAELKDRVKHGICPGDAINE
jgi:hypothetical protein